MMTTSETQQPNRAVDAHEWNIALTVLEKLGADVASIVQLAQEKEQKQTVVDLAKGLLRMRTMYPHFWGGKLE
jgi:hypothetical protein